MTVSLLVFTYRKEGISPEDFRSQAENSLMPLLKSLAGDKFPLSHTRRYPKHMIGPDLNLGAIAELVFQDEAAIADFTTVLKTPDNHAKISEVEDRFTDSSKTSIVKVTEATTTEK